MNLTPSGSIRKPAGSVTFRSVSTIHARTDRTKVVTTKFGKHLLSLVHGIILCAGRKNITQIRNAVRQDGDLSDSTHFLNHAPWCANRMQRRRMKFMIQKLRKQRIKKGDSRHLVFIIINDTNSKKDKFTQKMEALEFHYSHEDGKSMWSHNVVTSHVISDSHSFPWDFRTYFRKIPMQLE